MKPDPFFVVLLWWLLAEGRWNSWLIGLPAALAATATARALGQGGGLWISPLGLVRFVLHFLFASLAGGVDVAYRALHPRLPIDPKLVEYPLNLPPGPARLLFAAVVSLLPGTVSAELGGDRLLVHVLDSRQPIERHLRNLERHVAGLFAVPWQASPHEGGDPP
jgi:multicomponent Na+:H+ antiporter subunit E